jgi:predicted Zn-dependent protease
MLYAEQLGRTKREDEAVAQLERVKVASPDNPVTQYNIGLLYFQFGRYKEALAQAHRAATLGMPRTELMEKLKSKGQWAEPPTAGDAVVPAASAPAS